MGKKMNEWGERQGKEKQEVGIQEREGEGNPFNPHTDCRKTTLISKKKTKKQSTTQTWDKKNETT
jgi:hypothetical protein